MIIELLGKNCCIVDNDYLIKYNTSKKTVDIKCLKTNTKFINAKSKQIHTLRSLLQWSY